MAEKKMTKKMMYVQILSHTTDPAEREFLEHEVELLDKKNVSKSSRLTPVQEANETLKQAIVDYLTACGEKKTVSQIIKEVEVCNELSNQKVTALMRQLNLEFVVDKTSEKGVTYFSIA